jgi:uncharacterized membrane protein YphA (DoxX/SURF4 family)
MPFGLDPTLRLVVRVALALLFLAAAAHKLRDWAAFARALGAYGIVPPRLERGAAACLAAIEVVAGAALILSASAVGPALAAALLALYSGAIALNLARGRSDIDCGCSLGSRGQKLSWWLVARNIGLLGSALLALPQPSARPMIWIDVFTIACCTIALFLIYHVAENLLGSSVVAQRSEATSRALSASGGRRWSRL